MIYSGLVSITFRQLSPAEIVDLVNNAGLDGIEWGGDIHVPHGDIKRAKEVASITSDAGLKVAAYGSYYVLGDNSDVTIESVIESAVSLGAPTIRVWAGDKCSAEADEKYWDLIISESKRIGDMAKSAGITISYEYHKETLTDTCESAVRLMKEVSHPAVKIYWQPPIDMTVENRLKGLESAADNLTNIHVYQWKGIDRYLLADGADEWKQYFDYVNSIGGDHFAMIEFVKDDVPEVFLKDAITLKKLIGIGC